MPTIPVIEAAQRLATLSSHATTCTFSACSCGAVEERAEAVADFWREYREWLAEIKEAVNA